jgi:hypothetical protein
VARRGRSTVPTAIALVVAAVTLSACTTLVMGRAVRAHGPVTARELLLRDGDTTPLGSAIQTMVGDNYFTSARPPQCSAALLFEGSPLRPAGAADYAESAYTFDSRALYAESIDVYNTALNIRDVVSNGFRALSECNVEAIGVSPSGEFRPMKLSHFAAPADGLLVWTMTRADWTCDYGLAVIRLAALLISACDATPGFPMADWAAKRKAQLDGRAA